MALKKIKLPDNTVVDIQDARITGVDSSPTSGSGNVVTSGGVYSALSNVGGGGTVTSVSASGSNGISVSGGPITTSGTLSVSIDMSNAINTLTVGNSNAQRDDYAVVQYAGGGTTTTTYHRRKLSAVFAALNSSDVTTALGFTPAHVYSKATSIPSGGMLPNVYYNLGTISSATTFSMAAASDSTIVNHYFWAFDTGSSAPTITWSSSITKWYGGSAPTIAASKHYEVSVIDGVAICMEV